MRNEAGNGQEETTDRAEVGGAIDGGGVEAWALHGRVSRSTAVLVSTVSGRPESSLGTRCFPASAKVRTTYRLDGVVAPVATRFLRGHASRMRAREAHVGRCSTGVVGRGRAGDS